MSDEMLAWLAMELNHAPAAANRVAEYRQLIIETNATVRETADRLLDFDATPHSFAALKHGQADADGSER